MKVIGTFLLQIECRAVRQQLLWTGKGRGLARGEVWKVLLCLPLLPLEERIYLRGSFWGLGLDTSNWSGINSLSSRLQASVAAPKSDLEKLLWS